MNLHTFLFVLGCCALATDAFGKFTNDLCSYYIQYNVLVFTIAS